MNEIEDRLKEVCKTAQNVSEEEKEIAILEKKIADNMRETVAKIFNGSTKYRMKKQIMDYNGPISVWGFAVCLKDEVYFRSGFYGDWTGLRVTVDGKILTITQTISDVREYNFCEGNWSIYCENSPRNATDSEIATHATELAKRLLELLITRIDTLKDEKATLQRMAQVFQ